MHTQRTVTGFSLSFFFLFFQKQTHKKKKEPFGLGGSLMLCGLWWVGIKTQRFGEHWCETRSKTASFGGQVVARSAVYL